MAKTGKKSGEGRSPMPIKVRRLDKKETTNSPSNSQGN